MSDGGSIRIGPESSGQPIRDGVGCAIGAIGAAVAFAIFMWAMLGFPVIARGADQLGSATGAMKGHATYWPTCDSCAAASGELQEAMGSDWKGQFVTITRGDKSRLARLVTGCGCSPRDAGWQPVVDVSTDIFDYLLTPDELARGRATWGHIPVVVSWERGPLPTLPATDISPVTPDRSLVVWVVLILAGWVGGLAMLRRLRP